MTKRIHRDPDRQCLSSDPLGTAKKEVRRAIRADRLKAPADVARSLETISRQLYDPEFDAGEVARGTAARRRFRLAVGMTPKDYRDYWLLVTADQAVRGSEMAIAEVAAGLGFTEPEAFSRWFKYRMGISPLKLRARASADEVAPVTSKRSEAAGDERWSMRTLRRIMVGDVSRELGHSFIRWLLEVSPEAAIEPVST